MTFDREKLSDVVGNRSDLPELLAQEIRSQFELKFEHAPLSEISEAVGIFKVSEVKMSKMEGTIVFPEGKFEGEIKLNANQDPNRKRFTWAHEIGHFVNPYHHADDDDGFQCSETDIFRERKNIVEVEASRFASELLLPEWCLRRFFIAVENRKLNRIIELCEHMKVSKAAAIRRIANTCEFPFAFIFSLDNQMRFPRFGNFPYLRKIKDMPLPEDSLARNLTLPDNTISDPEIIKPTKWLSEDFDGHLIEQVYNQENGYKITMLTIA